MAIIAENDKLVFLNQNRQFVISVVVTYVLLDLKNVSKLLTWLLSTGSLI